MARVRAQADGDRIHALREERGISQLALSLRAGVAKRSVERAENGRKVLTDSLNRIATALGVEFPDLLSKSPSASRGTEPVTMTFTDDELKDFGQALVRLVRALQLLRDDEADIV